MNSQLLQKETNTGLLLWLSSNKWQREINQHLAQFGLTHVQYLLLCGLHDLVKEGRVTTQMNLADFVGIDKMMTSKVVRSLEVKKMLKRVGDKKDKRAICLHLTAFGDQVLRKTGNDLAKFDAAFFKSLGDKQKSFTKKLKKLNEGE